MILPCLASLVYFVGAAGGAAQVVYALTKLFTLVWPLIAVTIVLGETFPKVSWRDNRHLQALIPGTLFGCAVVALMWGLLATPLGSEIEASRPAIAEKAESLGITQRYWAFALFLSVFHSAIEEYYWRWFVFGQLRHLLPPAPAHLAAGASFAAHHLVIASQYFPLPLALFLGSLVGVGGICWSSLYQRQGTLSGAWVSHVIIDLGIMAIGAKVLGL